MIDNLFVRETENGYTGGLYNAEVQTQISGSFTTTIEGIERIIEFSRAWTPWSPNKSSLDARDGDVSVCFKEDNERFEIQRSEVYEVHTYQADIETERLEEIAKPVTTEAIKQRCLDNFLLHYPRKYDGSWIIKEGKLTPHSEYNKRYLLPLGEKEWKEF